MLHIRLTFFGQTVRMKRLGTIGILAAAGVAAASLALLPSSADIDRDQPGISVGETPAGSDRPGPDAPPEAANPEDGDAEAEGPAALDPAEQAARRAAEESGSAAVDAKRVPAPASRPRGGADSGTDSGGGGGSGSGSGSGSGRGVCEWDDDGWECDGGGDDGDDD